MTTPAPQTRVLAVFCAAPPRAAAADGAADAPTTTPYERPDDPAIRLTPALLNGSDSDHLTVLESPTLTELREAAERARPTHVHVCGSFSSASAANPLHGRLGPLAFAKQGETTTTTIGGNGDAAEDEDVATQVAAALASAGPQLRCVYLDVAPGASAAGAALAVAEELQQRRRGQSAEDHNVAVIGWPGDPPAAIASHFARAFFSHLASSASAPSPAEAFGVALLAAGAVAARGGGGGAGAAGAAGDDEAAAAAEDGHPVPASSSSTAPTIVLPRAPDLLLVSPDGVSDATETALPDARSVPRPSPESLPPGVTGPASVPGWARTALLAPRCEVRLRVAASGNGNGGNGSSGTNCDLAARLGCLGEGLRALLAAEVRALELVSPPGSSAADGGPSSKAPLLLEPLDPSPCPLPSSCQAVRAHVRARSGAVVPVVAVLPELVIAAANGGVGGAADADAATANCNGNGRSVSSSSNPSLALFALRHALLADALALQLLLPPLGAPMPRARARPDVAGGLPGAECLARTSIWAAALLRCLALGGAEEQTTTTAASLAGSRALALLGVTAVGCTPLRALSPLDVERLYALVVPSAALEEDDEDDDDDDEAGRGVSTALRLARPTAQEILFAASAGGGGRLKGKRSGNTGTIPRADPPTPNPAADDRRPLSAAAAAHAAAGNCPRQQGRGASLADCPDAALAGDLAAFLNATGHGDGPLPEPLLSLGGHWRVSLPALYRAVASRGGFRAAGAINWRGQVLPRCCGNGAGGGAGGAAASLRLAAAGHALRRLYASLLWDYERCHPSDVSGGERCPLCGRGDDDDAGLPGAGDWLACDGCDAWVHYSCDRRTRGGGQQLAPFEAYENEGKQYFCEKCGGGGKEEEGGGGGGGGGGEAAAAAALAVAAAAAAALNAS